MAQRIYGGVIWTNHALERLTQRGLTQQLAIEAYHHPDRSYSGNQAGSIVYEKKYQNSLITIIAKQNERSEWLILSAWIDPPLPGTVDAKKKESYLRYQRAGFWGKMWISLKRQLGLSY